MLSLDGVSLRIGSARPQQLLSEISASFYQGEFVAVIGPSGCGKSTLLKVIAGIGPGEEEGTVRWCGRDLSEEDFKPSEIGYVPQFSIAHEELTVRECVEYSARLRVSGVSGGERQALVTKLLVEVGMTEQSESRVKILSGGQKRRLALAMELVSSPPILLCDEVTSGLDPQSEEEIVALLRRVAREGNRLVISVTHSLRNLSDYDAVAVLYRGVLAYSGAPAHLSHYFRVEGAELVYSRLPDREPTEWQASWKKHADAFQQGRLGIARPAELGGRICPECASECPEEVSFCKVCGFRVPRSGNGRAGVGAGTPGILTQFVTLTQRRLRVFMRSRSQLWLQAGLVIGFPVIVSIFGWKGLPQIRNLSMGLDVNLLQQQSEALEFLKQASSVGSLVSGIIMFEVVLLTLMGANNSGREIAGERQIFEKEKLAGLSTGAYLLSKVLFLGLLCAVQSLWMGFFIHHTCTFPGDLVPQLLFLFLVNAAMTSVCLAISSFMGTAEQASLASIYLVGFQLPLSGAVLALPQWLGTITRPFIAAYWSWSGMLQTLRGERYYDIAAMVIQTTLSAGDICLIMLLVHIFTGLVLTYQGCGRTRME
jgi:ABC-type multidrug transport system ATPase subunit